MMLTFWNKNKPFFYHKEINTFMEKQKKLSIVITLSFFVLVFMESINLVALSNTNVRNNVVQFISPPEISETIYFDDNIDYEKYSEVITIVFGVESDYLKSIIFEKSKEKNLNPFMVASLIYAESTWRTTARGPEVQVAVYVENELTTTNTRAYGLMQVLDIHAPALLLLNPSYNIDHGTSILMNYGDLARGNLTVLLKNYNSGPNSAYYNMPYINKIKHLMLTCERNYYSL